ncbi:DUF2857 domain-containing protein [Klebsiella pneumoniae]|nr:DUF2857 domain-containing protein [Klebsiella pneumoniae]
MTWEGKTMIAGIATNALLTQLIMELKSGSIRRCEALGMTMYLISTPVSILTVCINHANLKMLMEQAQRERQRAQRIDRALALGGSIELMQRYFGLTPAEVSTRRRLSGIETRQGRCHNPTEEEELAVWEQWKAAQISNLASLEALDVMMLIAEQHDISLTVIWTLAKSWMELSPSMGRA